MFEAGELLVGLLTFSLGAIAGYIGERYSVCFVSPVREALLVPKKVILEIRYNIREFLDRGSYIPTFLGSFTAFLFLNVIGVSTPPEYAVNMSRLLLLLIGSILLGYYSAKADGCPFKMHVRLGRKEIDAFAYVIGFYVGIIYFYLFIEEIIFIVFR